MFSLRLISLCDRLLSGNRKSQYFRSAFHLMLLFAEEPDRKRFPLYYDFYCRFTCCAQVPFLSYIPKFLQNILCYKSTCKMMHKINWPYASMRVRIRREQTLRHYDTCVCAKFNVTSTIRNGRSLCTDICNKTWCKLLSKKGAPLADSLHCVRAWKASACLFLSIIARQ